MGLVIRLVIRSQANRGAEMLRHRGSGKWQNPLRSDIETPT